MTLEWLARGLGLLFAIFLSIFALDVFGVGYAPGELILALVMHLLPSVVPLLVALFVAWRSPMWGSALYVCVGIFFTFFFHTYGAWMNFLIVSLPVFVLAALFFIVARRTRTAESASLPE